MANENLSPDKAQGLHLNDHQLKSFNVRITLNEEQKHQIKKETGLDADEIEVATRWDAKSPIKVISKKDFVCW